jgi:hypothetical protein
MASRKSSHTESILIAAPFISKSVDEKSRFWDKLKLIRSGGSESQ